MSKYFGKTWWGEKWLDALSNLDYANRIPRGASYAKAGKVKKLEINGNHISATVQGTLNYFIKIEIPEFDENKFDNFINQLIDKQSIISNLLNRELDASVLDIANKTGLNIFPKSWKSLKMHCDCPDCAVPCKHLAAVFYVISREIDNNPFLVFKLHGVDLIEELKNRGVVIDKTDVIDVPNFETLLNKPKKNISIDNEFSRIDFSLITNNIQSICNILPEKTPFYQNANFIKKYQAEITHISKSVKKIIEHKSDFIEKICPKNPEKTLTKDTSFRLEIDKNAIFTLTEQETETVWNPEDFLLPILSIKPDYLEDYSPSVVALNQLILSSLYILASGNFAPAIFINQNKKYFAKYFAVRIDNAVAKVISDLETIMPNNFIFAQTGKNKKFTNVDNAAGLAVSYILDFFVEKLSNPDKSDKILMFLFRLVPEKFNAAGEKEIPASIKTWTDRLFFDIHQFKFKIFVNEKEKSLFDLEIAVDVKGNIINFSDILNLEKYNGIRIKILKEIAQISSFLDGYENYINNSAQKPIVYNLEQLSEFLFSIAPSLKLLGVEILLPKSLQNIVKPKVSMKISAKRQDGKSYIKLNELLDFDWRIALGDNLISFEQFFKLYEKASGLIKIKQNYFYIDSADIERIKKTIGTRSKLNSMQLLQTSVSESFDGANIQLTDEAKKIINQLRSQPEMPSPENLNAVLRPYQLRGYNWLYKNYQLGFGSILADDMGLGKTLQTISFIQKLKNDNAFETKKTLIVVPTGLINNWQAELQKFAPKITLFTYHGHDRNLEKFNHDILLTTYGLIRSDVEKLKKIKVILLYAKFVIIQKPFVPFRPMCVWHCRERRLKIDCRNFGALWIL